MVSTKFVGRKNPFTGESILKTIDVSKLEVRKDPIASARKSDQSKYADLYARMEINDCIRVETSGVRSVSKSFNRWLSKNQPNYAVHYAVMYPNDPGYGRIWLVDKL